MNATTIDSRQPSVVLAVGTSDAQPVAPAENTHALRSAASRNLGCTMRPRVSFRAHPEPERDVRKDIQMREQTVVP
jgi:hypothetical protein